MKSVTFAQLKLAPKILAAVTHAGYHEPTPIQRGAIPHLLKGRDLLGTAKTGTGKTAAFALPILQHLTDADRMAKPGYPLVLALAPTRELAIQIDESFQQHGRKLRFRSTAIYGGVKQGGQVRALRAGVEILSATPGRLLDLMKQQEVSLDSLKTFVLDEADRMLDMGFLPDLRRIIQSLPARRQSMFFSATMPKQAASLANELLTRPARVSVAPTSSTHGHVRQDYYQVERTEKIPLLVYLLRQQSAARTLVFVRTKRGCDSVTRRLKKVGVAAKAIHSDKSQNARLKALDEFREFKIQVLVATDIAARGIDIDDVTHVFNYDLPDEPENYVHRIGRTARAGADGVAISFCLLDDNRTLVEIEKVIGKRLAQKRVPRDLVRLSELSKPAMNDSKTSTRGPKRKATQSRGRKSASPRRQSKHASSADSSTSTKQAGNTKQSANKRPTEASKNAKKPSTANQQAKKTTTNGKQKTNSKRRARRKQSASKPK